VRSRSPPLKVEGEEVLLGMALKVEGEEAVLGMRTEERLGK